MNLEEFRKRSKTGFVVKDGIINEEEYKKAFPRTMILMKETPFDETCETEYDITKALDKGFKKDRNHALHHKIFINLAYRVYALGSLINGYDPFSFDEIKNPTIQNYQYSKYFHSSAYVNVRKYDGKPVSKDKDLISISSSDNDLLRPQIDNVINPSLILCNHTFDYYKEIYKDQRKDIRRLGDSLFFSHLLDNKRRLIYAAFYHPSHRGSDEKTYNRIVSDFKYPEVQNWIKENLS